MPRFFIPGLIAAAGDTVCLPEQDARHAARALRMRCGEELVICDANGTDYLCTLSAVSPQAVQAKVLRAVPCAAEPGVRLHIFQGLPKADKLELIIQKCVELGVYDITPVLMKNCVSRPDAAALRSKLERWQKIADEAAKQCGRGILPQICAPKSFSAAMEKADGKKLLLYEKGGIPLRQAVLAQETEYSVFIGPEGGIDPAELQCATACGCTPIGLGGRILRTETAPVAAAAAIMTLTGNLE